MSSRYSDGEFWKKLKPFLPRSKDKDTSSSNIVLSENGKLIKDSASVFNKHFTIFLVDKDTLSKNEGDFVNYPNIISIKEKKNFNLNFQFNPVSTDYISNLLQNIDVRKTSRPDGVTPLLVKKASPVIVNHTTKLFNHCISTSTWPKDWKLANVKPVYRMKTLTNATTVL